VTHELPHKYTAPGVPRGSIVRPRLNRLVAELLDTYSIVEIIAAPGSGKTVQAQFSGETYVNNLSWLNMDRSDQSAAGLLFDLATTLGAVAIGGVEATQRMLHAGGTAEEAAAVLAGSTRGHECLLVIDECQQIAASPDAASALDTFIEYVPETMRVLLLARENLPWPLQKRYVHGQIAQVADAALSLTLDETLEYVTQQGGDPKTADRIYEATGGWVAGVAFAARFGVRGDPSLRDLSTYLGAEILDPLHADEQEFLLATSVLDSVTRGAAAALCGETAHRLWAVMSARHLPATTTTESTIVYHSLFRSFLHDRLLATRPERHAELRRRHASHLARTQQFEAATEAWLAQEDLDAAWETARQALPSLYQRADWPVVMRWLGAFGEARILTDPIYIGAWIRGVYGSRQFDETRILVRRLQREGRLRPALEADRRLLATTAWAMQAHPQEARNLLDTYEGDHRSEAVRFMVETTTGTHPAAPPQGTDWEDVERLMSWGLFLQGRFGELARMASDDPGAPILNPNVVLAAAFRGDEKTGSALWLRVPQEIRERPHSRFIEGMLLLSGGRTEESLCQLRLAMTDSHKTGFPLGLVYEIFAGYLALTLGDTDQAVTALEPVLESMSRTGEAAYVEWAQCFLGIAYAQAGRTSEAQLILREAVTSMARCQRRLLLPLAAAALSEAEAQLGTDEAAHRAAELAYHAATLTGSFLGLIWAIRLFPDLQPREIGRDPSDLRWRRIVATPSVRASKLSEERDGGDLTVRLQPFGRDRDMHLNGKPAKIGRTKILELVSCLALHPNGIDRFELQRLLFPEADQRNGGNHFRQITHKLRHSTGITLERQGNLIFFPRSVALLAVDLECERLLNAASASARHDRVTRLSSALDLMTGPYLEGSVLSWAEERRNYLDIVQEEARLELARLFLELGDPAAARSACEAVLEANRYCDPAYRVLVHIERKVGSESSALAVYRRAAGALAELGLRPGDARRLMEPPDDSRRRSSPSLTTLRTYRR
jgi:ATP/maltotriose-dependent transcriptional regulator MalT/DNA-binding SARP family transcriptional activator